MALAHNKGVHAALHSVLVDLGVNIALVAHSFVNMVAMRIERNSPAFLFLVYFARLPHATALATCQGGRRLLQLFPLNCVPHLAYFPASPCYSGAALDSERDW